MDSGKLDPRRERTRRSTMAITITIQIFIFTMASFFFGFEFLVQNCEAAAKKRHDRTFRRQQRVRRQKVDRTRNWIPTWFYTEQWICTEVYKLILESVWGKGPYHTLQSDWNDAMNAPDHLAIADHVPIVDWALRNRKYDIRVIFIRVRHLDVIQWLISQADNQTAEFMIHSAILIACYHGQLDIVQWLCDTNAVNNAVMDHVCDEAAQKGHLHILKYLAAHNMLSLAKIRDMLHWPSRSKQVRHWLRKSLRT